jgi:nucleoside-diphosphate-sugar epimerase
VAEDAAKQPVGAYGKSKWGAEEALRRHHEARGLPVVVLRPCIVYGGRDRHAYPALSRLARLPFVPLPNRGGHLLDLVHVSDVVQAVIAAAVMPDVVGRAYNVTDGQAHSYRDILLALERASGRRPWILSVPGAAWGMASRLVPVLRGLGLDLHYSVEAARRDLSYRPRMEMDAGLAETFREAAASSTAAG